MTSLGGDYYDFISLGENKTGIVLGDVAGHGVPAGLLMAMAKAAVLMADEEEKQNPTLLTQAVHQMFIKIKNRQLKKMMTFQYLTIEAHTGEVNFTNAGHCFPIIIRPQKQEAEFIEQIALPLGISKKSAYPSLSFKINPGEALLLYTDGIVEAVNEKGEDYGFERLKNTICSTYDPNPEVFYENLYQNYCNWSPAKDDDLTLIIICRTDKNEN
jgi:sigma-B regulation protein RsbU (phosphoserine phosphatase)